jgi:hypothetical protein
MVNDFPFSEEKISNNTYLREFYPDVATDELQWHYDEEDRLVESLNENDWQIQFDNELPKRINGTFFIEKNRYHRILKGTTPLKLKIKKIKC